MLSSKQLIEITGISRATLNNYVSLGILPSPVVKSPAGNAGRATRLGYFEDDAVDRIRRVQSLKKQGLSMAEIAGRVGEKTRALPASPLPLSDSPAVAVTGAGQGTLTDHALHAASHHFTGPAYLVNNDFELIWWNRKASESLFPACAEGYGGLRSRRLFELLFQSPLANDEHRLRELLGPHLQLARNRLTRQALIKLYSSLDGPQLQLLRGLLDALAPVAEAPVAHFPMLLTGEPGYPLACDLYACCYLEGVLFSICPVAANDDFLLNFLSQRDPVINQLLHDRRPRLGEVTALVATIQDSARIRSELPAEEYFELINSIWQQSEPVLSRFYGTYGKHSGDGLVYYFFPQPERDYRLDAIHCSLELQAIMRRISRTWQSRKGWFHRLHLNIGLSQGREWFGSYHAGRHADFTLLGETCDHASRISEFACNGTVWATKAMLNQLEGGKHRQLSFGIARRTESEQTVFVSDSYAELGSLLNEAQRAGARFEDVAKLPITEIRDLKAAPG